MGLILLRHTRPLGADGLCYGRTDLDLAPDFQSEALRLSTELPRAARIITSPLTRCARLAQALADAWSVPLSQDPRLAEMDFGTWEGRPWSAIPRAELDAWAADLTQARPHGGETVAELDVRTRAGLQSAEPPALIVTHAGVIKAALSWSRGPAGWQASIPFGGWVRLTETLAESPAESPAA